ncbi:pseudaminic acid synthase [Flavobacterium croceum]|uniref:pseudaminic acid synthase n=1 Tax=Flavobacterium croceum TaxID=370975 RepID=UPI0024A8C51A|nr:pseudaminic acid synthase [Flavobacterium croceum]
MNIKTYIIAELSANHNNDFELAEKTIHAMAASGADAVKVQTYKPESLTLDLDTGYFAPRTEGLWKGYTPWKLYTEAAMPYEWQPKLMKIANDLGMDFFSSPFDLEGVDFLEKMQVPMYKIASFEITDIPLIKYTASKGKPIIMSTGVATEEDIQLAIDTCQSVGNNQITILKCTSQYPATIEQANLLTIPDMKLKFGVAVGLSDHTMGSLVPTVAVALGATVVEKHFILDRNLGGPDSVFSMEPHEFKEMVDSIRNTEASLGKISYDVSEQDKNRRRSLFVVKDIKKGELITEENIRSIRPGFGLHPKYFHEVLGKTVNKSIEKGSRLVFEDIEK